MIEPRDWNDPKYKQWRMRVKKRDRFKCRLCGGDSRLEAHHIKRWADCPELRYVVSNGITLCKQCHEKFKGHEQEYEAVLNQIVTQSNSDAFLSILMKKYEKKTDIPGD